MLAGWWLLITLHLVCGNPEVFDSTYESNNEENQKEEIFSKPVNALENISVRRRRNSEDEEHKRQPKFHSWGGKRYEDNDEDENQVGFDQYEDANIYDIQDQSIPTNLPLLQRSGLVNDNEEIMKVYSKRQPAFSSWGGKRDPEILNEVKRSSKYYNSISNQGAFRPLSSDQNNKRYPAFNSWAGKRAAAFNSWGGKRAAAFNSWGGKRAAAFNSWGGKRAAAFNSWGGKRAAAFNSWGGKRAAAFNSWGGKRAAPFNSWGGKRAAAFNSWGGKRAAAFNSWGGKRAAAFNSWGGKRAAAFNSWGGKRTAALKSLDGKINQNQNTQDENDTMSLNEYPDATITDNELHPGNDTFIATIQDDDSNSDILNGKEAVSRLQYENGLETTKRGAAFNTWGGKRTTPKAFNSWGGKRTAAFNSWGGKRSSSSFPLEDFDNAELRSEDFKGDQIDDLSENISKFPQNEYYNKQTLSENEMRAISKKGGRDLLKQNPRYLEFLEKRNLADKLKKARPAFSSWAGKRSPIFSPWYVGNNVPTVQLSNGKRRPAFSSWGGKRSGNSEMLLDEYPASSSTDGIQVIKNTLELTDTPDEDIDRNVQHTEDNNFARRKREVDYKTAGNNLYGMDLRFRKSEENMKKNTLLTRMLLHGELTWPMMLKTLPRGVDFYAWGGKR